MHRYIYNNYESYIPNNAYYYEYFFKDKSIKIPKRLYSKLIEVQIKVHFNTIPKVKFCEIIKNHPHPISKTQVIKFTGIVKNGNNC